MTYSLVDDGGWPADIRARIVAAMDEAVATYNANGYFNTHIYVQYHPAVPTAEANYPDYLKFGGSISTQVAMHEISHTLGTGTTWQWDAQFGGDGVWNGAAAKNFVKLFDGPGAELRKSGVHYYPYGLNYASEDNPLARIRLVKMVSAMRYDMGLDGGADADGDGLPNEWEMYRFGNLSQTGAGDTDGDGISNRDEYLTEGDPIRPCPVKDGHTYVIRARHSQKVLEAADVNAGAITRQNPANGSDLQKWTASYRGAGFWKFTNVASGKVLEVAGASWDAGADVMQWNDLGNDNQQWRIVPDGQIYSKIFNRGSRNMVIDVDGGTGATGNNTPISQYFDVLGGTNQDWAFDDVTPGVVVSTGLRAEYKMEGNARDSGGFQYHGTATAGVSYTAGRVDGSAATFNGTSGNIRVPAMVDRNFTVACWVKTTATGSGVLGNAWYGGSGILDAEVGGVVPDFGLTMISNRAAFGIGGPDTTITSTVAINNGVWHHLAATYELNGAMKLYVDGVQRASATGPTGARTAPANFNIGSVGGAGGFFNGSIDEVRIYDTALSSTEITRLAGVGQTCVASYGFENDLRDASKHGNHGTGTPALGFTTGKTGSNALLLDGDPNFATIPASISTDFSIAFWMKTSATGGTGQWWAGKPIIDAEVPGAAADWGIALLGDKVGFGVGNVDNTILSNTLVNDAAWHYVVATRSSSSGVMRLYVDGVLEQSQTGPTGARNIPHAILLGRSLAGPVFFTGALDELKIYNYALSPAEATSLTSGSLPAGWTATEIGNPGSDGYAGYSATNGGTFTLTSGGNGIAATGDQLQLLSKPFSGDGAMISRLSADPTNSAGTTAATARAGLTFRAATGTNPAAIEFTYDRTTGLNLRYRSATGGAVSGQFLELQPLAPLWLRLARNGNLFSASYATTAGVPTESDWLPAGSQTLDLPNDTLLGLTVAPASGATVATAAFDNVATSTASIGGGQAAAWRMIYFGTPQNSGDAADDADPDGDNIPNLFERAYGTLPTSRDAVSEQPTANPEAGFMTLHYRRDPGPMASDLTLGAQWSANLTAPWSTSGIEDSLESTEANGIQHRVAKVPLANFPDYRGFMRLQVTTAP
ncbi:LamG-like jellyroll fold domain-containing protein [Haloferula sp. BvORR071]|uniref:LamG-like jellyroll fold domain-containing protein n=1 Tax=Haloferula sp. BvORR071 TaxID=1396141 RepID=UPI000695B7B5|nr:LamG-like jellyroll fold domain-containing protein [Haloferula sp. BvORR071]